MPQTEKGRLVLSRMRKTYGPKKGTQVYWASVNAGKLKGVEPRRKRR